MNNMLRRFIISISMLATAILASRGQLNAQCPRQTDSHQATVTSVDLSSAPKVTIEKVRFTGQTGLNPAEQAEIVEAIKNKIGNYEPDWLEEFGERLRDAWKERGYFKAQIETINSQGIRATQAEKVFHVTVNVESGRRYYLGDIRFLGGTQFSLQQMRSLFPIQAGELFNNHKFADGFEALRKVYATRGFINSSFIPTVSYDEAHGLISVKVEIVEGTQFHISDAHVIGMDPISAKALLLNSGLETGKVADPGKVYEFAEQHHMEAARFIDEKRGLVCVELTTDDSPQN